MIHLLGLLRDLCQAFSTGRGLFYWLSTYPLSYPQYRDTTRVDERPREVYTYIIQTIIIFIENT